MLSFILFVGYLVIGFSYALRTIPPEMMIYVEYPWLEFTALILFWAPIAIVHGVKSIISKVREFLIFKGIL